LRVLIYNPAAADLSASAFQCLLGIPFRVQGIERHPTASLLHYETGAGHLVFHDFPTPTGLGLVKLGVGEEPVLPIPTITLILV